MSVVLTPIRSSVATRAGLRPARSPMAPKMIDPIGRAAKPTPNVANESSVLTTGSAVGKKTCPSTSAEAVA